MRTLWHQATDCSPMSQKCINSGPILKHPDPERLFITEVDASETGVGVVLSQPFSETPKIYPVAFF